MREYILVLGMSIIIVGCSQSYNSNNRSTKPPNDYSVLEAIDSSKILAAVKPSDYNWNKGDNLIDLIRKKYKPVRIIYGYPNPFSPPTFIAFNLMKSDSISFYICNTDENFCFKFQEGYLEKGIYSLGFQKLDMEDPGVFVLKIETSDSTFTHKYLMMP